MKNLSNRTIVKTVLKTALSAAALLLLSTPIHARRQNSATPEETQKQHKYHIVVANLSGQSLRVGLRKEGDKGRQMYATESLAAGQNIDRVLDRKLKAVLVRGHGRDQTIQSNNIEQGALFLIERDNAGDGFMVTAFVNDHEGWLQWRDAVARAQAKLNQ